MANLSAPTEVKNIDENETPFSVVDIPAGGLGILRKVPPQQRKNKNQIYSPSVLSLGPYHHGKLRYKQFPQVEEIKDEIVNNTLDSSVKSSFLGEILKHVARIRSFYEELPIEEYKDEALAEMMLRDACFILYHMEFGTEDMEANYLSERLGMSGYVSLCRDFCMLENQIPFWIIKRLITLTFNDYTEEFLCQFLSSMCFGENFLVKRLPWEDGMEEPLHLLEAWRKALIMKEDTSSPTVERRGRVPNFIKSGSGTQRESALFGSATDLKIKGIHFGPSSHCLEDVRFHSFALYGKLLLPVMFVRNNTQKFLANLIAFEVSAETKTNFGIQSYVNLMKSLLQTPKDVQELREKGILFSSLRDDEEVLRVFKEIDTYGQDNEDIFLDVKMRINKHFDSKVKMWMGELFHTHFRSPWTAIALFAATFLLCLTFLQTYYTMNPVKNN